MPSEMTNEERHAKAEETVRKTCQAKDHFDGEERLREAARLARSILFADGGARAAMSALN